MNIMFLVRSFGVGGVSVVTNTLANYMVSQGHRVSIFAFVEMKDSTVDNVDSRVRTYILRTTDNDKENVYAMRAVMVEDQVQIVINQWGLPFTPLRVARKAAEGLDIKFISVYHNTPNMNGRLQSIDVVLSHCSNPLKHALLKGKRCIFKQITARGMRYNYRQSDRFMVLSPSFVGKFKSFTGIKHPDKLLVQTNPVTIDSKGYCFDFDKKEKEIIYVGRVNHTQKRTSRIIDTWGGLEKRFPDWRMTIVGDGEARKDIERQTRELQLERVSFEGFQNPLEYYKRASILILTSEFEGFPLVLAEAMSFGVVPVVYGSYSAVYDIINDGINGRIVKPVNGKFVAADMANAMASIMSDKNKREQMALQAIETSKGYSIETIYKQWMQVFENLLKN